MIIALFACSPGSVVLTQDDKPGFDDTATTDTAPGETGDTEDTDTTEPTVPAEPLCGHLSGMVAEGTRWEWTPLIDQPQYNQTRIATITEMDGSIVRIEDVMSYEYHGAYDYLNETTTESVYNCDSDGVWLLGQVTSYYYAYDENVTESEYMLELDEPALITPLEGGIGTSWTSSYNGRQLSNGYESPYRQEFVITVIGEEDVEVPFGVVPALRLMSETNGYPYKTWYVGTDIGVVEDTAWLLENYAP